jgi:hypothetical protein
MTDIATLDWNAKVNEALERADIMAGWSRHFYSISDLKTFVSHLYARTADMVYQGYFGKDR